MATFILVHGTFAKSAHWPFLQDRLAETARAAGDEPLFEQLPWTGSNRTRARQAAASAIFTLLQKIQRTSANQKIFLIGHSHGGSAIAYFLKEHPEAAKTLAGCAFLSTPFVAIRPRREAIQLMVVLLFFPIFAFAGLWTFPGLPGPNDDVNLEQIVYLFGGMGLILAIEALAIVFIRTAGDPQKLVEQSIRQQTANIPAGNYLFLRCSGDEAAAALSATQFIAWLGMKASKIPELLIRPFKMDPTMTKRRFLVRAAVGGNASVFLLIAIGYGWYVVLSDIVKLGVFGYFFSPDGPFVGTLGLVHMIHIVFTFVSFVVVSFFLLCLSAVILIFLHRRSPHGLLDGRGCLPACWSS